MIKFFLFVTLFSSILYSNSIDKKIKIKKRQLHSKQIEYNKMDKKLSTIAKKIIDAKAQSITLDKMLNKSEKHIKENQNKFNELNAKKKILDQEINELNIKIEDKREKFISLVADKFSMALVLDEIKKPTPQSIILQETYSLYAKENEKKIKKLTNEIEELNKKNTNLINEQKDIQTEIQNYQVKIEEYKSQKEQKTELIQELARDKAIYKKRFDKIRANRRALQRKLAKLKIIKQDRADKRKSKVTSRKHRRHHNRQERIRIASYHGGKTISPLSGSKLIKRFGTYIDPIYKFRIFNKSITLKAPYQGARVKSVLDGKIVFAENSGGMLGKVVIIAHKNNIHTIYAKLSRLAPGIHAGRRVSKGSTIGKVNSTLMFEVTKNNKHMNPLKLIRL
ncbi:MAG: peptidoglycan DD-metalloendopeptidase family protein [Sulfurovaceae bacterium]|nr:peptidoglycan DD-metalloendopeptidase family protein [Sulfurovaceae bacterium]